jgi:hypothetical protein
MRALPCPLSAVKSTAMSLQCRIRALHYHGRVRGCKTVVALPTECNEGELLLRCKGWTFMLQALQEHEQDTVILACQVSSFIESSSKVCPPAYVLYVVCFIKDEHSIICVHLHGLLNDWIQQVVIGSKDEFCLLCARSRTSFRSFCSSHISIASSLDINCDVLLLHLTGKLHRTLSKMMTRKIQCSVIDGGIHQNLTGELSGGKVGAGLCVLADPDQIFNVMHLQYACEAHVILDMHAPKQPDVVDIITFTVPTNAWHDLDAGSYCSFSCACLKPYILVRMRQKALSCGMHFEQKPLKCSSPSFQIAKSK